MSTLICQHLAEALANTVLVAMGLGWAREALSPEPDTGLQVCSEQPRGLKRNPFLCPKVLSLSKRSHISQGSQQGSKVCLPEREPLRVPCTH